MNILYPEWTIWLGTCSIFLLLTAASFNVDARWCFFACCFSRFSVNPVLIFLTGGSNRLLHPFNNCSPLGRLFELCPACRLVFVCSNEESTIADVISAISCKHPVVFETGFNSDGVLVANPLLSSRDVSPFDSRFRTTGVRLGVCTMAS